MRCNNQLNLGALFGITSKIIEESAVAAGHQVQDHPRDAYGAPR